MARFTTLYSGSAGNCAVIEENGKYILVDMGRSCKATITALNSIGLSLDDLCGILITHEHSDHISGLMVFLKKVKVPVYGTSATLDAIWAAAAVPETACLIDVEAQTLNIGGFLVSAFPTSHDAAGSCGYRVQTPDGSIMTIATDLGKMTADIFVQFQGAGLAALESNYDAEMLRTGPYPASLKARIASARGHLSNKDSAMAVAQLIDSGCRRIALCHLSEENNHPTQVKTAIENALFETGQEMPEECIVQISRRHTVSDWMEF